MNKRFFSLCATALVCTGIIGQDVQNDSTIIHLLDEVVVSDSRFELKRENSGKTVIKITAEELERSQGKNIAEIINTKSGLEIAGSRGREGTVFGVFGRGGRGKQVLVIVDGVRISDPSSFSSEYDLRLLSMASVESIEIIKGASSTLYGTNAATAVINITTKKASTEKATLNIASNVGTNQTADNQNYNISHFSNSAQLSGSLERFSYLMRVSNSYSDGLSALITPENEQDDFSRWSADLKLGYRITDAFSVNLYGNQTKTRTQFDETFGLIDAPYQSSSKQERIGIAALYGYTNGSFTINGAYSDYNTESISAFPATFNGSNFVFDAFNKYNFNNRFYTVIGLNYIEDKIESETNESFTLTDPYANVVYVSGFGLNLNIGARFNTHSEYGSNFVYNFNPSFALTTDNGYLKFLSSYATSYITPNLIQLFGAFGANPDLEPEDDRTIEGGLEYAIAKKFRVSALYFNRKEENFITFDANFVSINAPNTIDAQGVEVEMDWHPIDELQINTNYTFTERKGDSDIRIPKHKINASLAYEFCENTNATLSYSLTGERSDTDFSTFTTIPLDSFSLVDLYVGHELIPNELKVFINANNILNETYTEVLGFTTLGRNIRMGFTLTL